MARIIKYGTEAREALIAGAKTLNDVVSSTLGPLASNVAFDREYGAPTVIHDGVGVAKETDLIDPFERVGADILREAASKTNDEAGDGTTTATVLGYEIAKEAHRNIVAGANQMQLRKGINMAAEAMDKNLKELAIPITKQSELLQVATISAQNDEIGSLVAEGIERMGDDGVLAIEESGTSQTYLEIKEGMEFTRGWLSKYFVNNAEKQEASLDNPYILVTDLKLSSIADVIDWIKGFAADQGKENANLVIIAEDITEQALQFLILNHIQTNLKFLAIKAPSFNENQKDFLKDIAVVTGAFYISGDSGMKLSEENYSLNAFGRASRVTSTEKSTVIVDGAGEREDIDERIAELKNTLEKAEVDFDREKLQERIARLTTGIGVIYVGGASETEMRERKERFIDAISATRAAKQEGIVPGGETALVRAALGELPTSEVRDIQLGIDILKHAAYQPFRKLMSNAGFDAGEKMSELKQVVGKKNWGIDATDGVAKDLVKNGIIDPVKVTRSALENAASCAGSLITTSTVMVNEPKKDAQYS